MEARTYKAEFNEKQRIAIDYLSPANQVEMLLYGGGVYSGKTWLGCYWQIARRLKYPNTRGLIGRYELKNLQLSTMRRFWYICGEMGLRQGVHYKYNGQYNTISWYNGSETILMDMAGSPGDVDFHRFGSLELTDYFLDEVAEMSWKAVEMIDSRTRYNLIGGRPKGLMSCNPAKGWLYNTFYKPYVDGTMPAHRAFVPALLRDNTIKPDPVYEAKIARMNERDRKRLLEGDWNFDESPDRIFDYDDLLRCFRNDDLKGEMYLTGDIARMGKDRTVLALWQGLTLLRIEILRKHRVDEVTKRIKEIQAEKNVKLKNIVVDEDGVGGGVVDNLRCIGFMNGSRANKPDKFQNLKAECYFKLGEIVEQGKLVLPVEHRDDIIRELDMIRRKNPDGDRKLSVTSKEEIARQHGVSPDLADAIMMRMYFELHPNYGKYQFG